MDWTYADVAGMIDHSLLRPVLPQEELEAGTAAATPPAAAAAPETAPEPPPAAPAPKGKKTKAGKTAPATHG